LKNVLITCFSLSLVLVLSSGCLTLNSGSNKWPIPERPSKLPVEIIPIAEVKDGPINTGFYLSSKDARNLVDNVDELKAYVEKLEALIKKMKKYYGDK